MRNFKKLSKDQMKLVIGGVDSVSFSAADTCSGETLCGSNCVTKGKAYTKCSIKPGTSSCTCGGF